MERRSKPDSSYASNRLTRNNGPPKPLLSTFRNNHSKKDAPLKPEPATDDEPVSSSDEDAKPDPESESDPEVNPRASGETLEEKMAKNSSEKEQELSPPRSSRAPQKTKARGITRKRLSTGSAIQKENNTDADLFEEFGSSRLSKRRKTIDYSARGHRPSDNHAAAPSPSQDSAKSATPRGNTRKAKPKADKKAESTSTKEKAQKNAFKVPKGDDVDIPSPNARTRSRPEFKAPPFPADASSSSFAASSAREPPTFDFDDNDDDSPLSTPLSSASSTLMQQFADMDDEMLALKDELEDSEPKEGSFCPMCKQAVDPGLLMRFQAQPRQRIRDQQRFCESHKQQTAETEWQHKGYPSIDWDRFDDRINGHFDYIDSLLVSESPSYYRNILDTTLKSGKAKNFRLTLSGDGLETISCGYYGTRGAGKMLHALTTRFSRKLRRLAGSDPIVKTAGVVGYTQAVLVPELASRLVKEDMDVDDESARQILRESIDIGEKLNFALDDKVPVPDQEEEEQATAMEA